MGRKVLFVSNKYPFPADDGKKTVLAGFLGYLLERLGEDGVAYVVVGKRQEIHREVPCRMLWIEPPGLAAQAWSVCTGLFGQKSLQELLTYSPRVERALRAYTKEFRPDLILADTLRTGQYFWERESADCPRILYMDDLLYVRFQRLLELSEDATGAGIKAAGTFAQFLPGVVRRLLDQRQIRRLLYRTEMRRIERRELASPGRFDRCLLINPNEARLLHERCPSGAIASVKPLLFESASAPPPRQRDDPPLFLLFGSLRHPVYRASVVHFLERGMPEVQQVLPNARIDIIGGGADEQIGELCGRFGGQVRLRGYVDSIDATFARASALLAPMTAAGGLKLKVITALYHGLPVIATDHAVDGIPLTDGMHYLRENRIEAYAARMAELCDPTHNQRISRNAASAFQEHFGKAVVFAEYDRLFDLTSTPARAESARAITG